MAIDIDWNAEWKAQQLERRGADDAAFWDKRAPGFAVTCGTSPYSCTFLEMAKIQPGETVFDMGCGSGALALPLAKAGHEVYAADFSQVMMDLMMQAAARDGIDGLIHSSKVAWADDWQQTAADIPVCDVAVASRSIATDDLASALMKLEGKARRRVCITLSCGESPRCDDVLAQVMGRKRVHWPDYVFAMNILWEMGVQPQLDYIRSSRPSYFDSYEEGIEKTCEIFHATAEEKARLEAYARDHLRKVQVTWAEAYTKAGTPEAGHPEQSELVDVWSFDHERVTSWAFIAWDK